jgi:hypothetical protein
MNKLFNLPDNLKLLKLNVKALFYNYKVFNLYLWNQKYFKFKINLINSFYNAIQ